MKKDNAFMKNKDRLNILIVLGVSLLSIVWFGGSDFISVGDFAFPLSGRQFFQNTMYLWDSDIVTGTSAARQVAFIMPYSILSWFFEVIGSNQQILERVLFFYWFAMSGVSAYYLCRLLKSSPLGALGGALFYMMNFYAMSIIWHLASGLLTPAYAAFPLIVYLFIRMCNKGFKFKDACLLMVAWFLLGSYMYANPALVVVHFLPLFFIFLFALNRQNYKRALLSLVPLGILFLLLNVFWLLPLIADITATFKSASNVAAGFISDKATYVLNSAKLSDMYGVRGVWDILGGYKDTPYHSWGQTFRSPVFILVGYLITVISFLPFLKKKRIPKTLIAFAALYVFTIFIIKGPNPPFGKLNMWVYEHVPYILTAFRANIQKWGMALMLATTPLLGYGITCVYKFLYGRFGKRRARAVTATFFLLAFGLNAYPFWTGEVIFPGSVEFPGARFTVPSSYSRLKEWNKEVGDSGRILSLPITRSGNVSYFWQGDSKKEPSGYSGGDFIRWYATSPVIFLANNSLVDELARGIVAQRPTRGYYSLMGVENVRYLMVHNDWNWDFWKNHPWQYKLNTHKIAGFLGSIGLNKPDWQFGELDIYKVPDEEFVPKIYSQSALPLVVAGSTKLLPLADVFDLSDYPAIAFARQNSKVLSLIDGTLKVPLLLANKSYDDLVIDLVAAEALKPGGGEIAQSRKPELLRLDGAGFGKLGISKDGMYGVWVKMDGKALGQVESLRIEKISYRIPQQVYSKEWVKVGSVDISKGGSELNLIRKELGEGEKELPLYADVLIAPEGFSNKYEKLLGSKSISYLFYEDGAQEPDDKVLDTIYKKPIYASKEGEYEVSVLVKPKKERVRVNILNEKFNEAVFERWNFRLSGSRVAHLGAPDEKERFLPVGGNHAEETGSHAGSAKDRANLSPVPIFGANFYPAHSPAPPLHENIWRWISNDGEVLLINPIGESVNVDISFTISSFVKRRDVVILLDNKAIKRMELSGSKKRPGKTRLKDISKWRQLARFSGAPLRVELSGLTLRPGINVLSIKSAQSAIRAGNNGKFTVSLAIRDDLSVKSAQKTEFATRKEPYVKWYNRKGFDVKVSGAGLVLRDRYSAGEKGVAFITRKVDNVNIFEYPFFSLRYSWDDNRIQVMDAGFKIDTDEDGIGDVYFVRSLPSPGKGEKEFEVNLLEELWSEVSDAVINKASLVAIDFFPHKKWGSKIVGDKSANFYEYRIKGLRLSTKQGSVVTVYEDTFIKPQAGIKENYKVSEDRKSLLASILLNGERGDIKSTEVTQPLRSQSRNMYIELPFKVTDKSVQSVGLRAGYDTSGNGIANKFVPVGRRVALFKWKLVTKDINEPMFMYEAELPDDLPVEGIMKIGGDFGSVILKDGKPLAPALDNDFNNAKYFTIKAGHVLIKLPRCRVPDTFKYELFYMPKEWVKRSVTDTGFDKFVLPVDALRQALPGEAAPVELKFILRARLAENSAAGKEYDFSLLAPVYKEAVLPRIKSIKNVLNLPSVRLDNKEIKFGEQRPENDVGAYSSSAKVFLSKGLHTLGVDEPGGLEVKSIKVKPVSTSGASTGRSKAPVVEFKQVNPTRYVVEIKKAKEPFTLVFSESFHDGWRAYIREIGTELVKGTGASSYSTDYSAEPWSAILSVWRDKGRRTELEKHFMVNGYANGWIVPVRVPANGDGAENLEIILEYRPQRVLEVGLLVTITTLMGCLIYLGIGAVMRAKGSE